MNIRVYLDCLQDAGLIVKKQITNETEISKVSYNSKDIIEGTLFICKGIHFKEQYLLDAIEEGACCYLSETEYKTDCDCIIVSDIRRAMALVVNLYFEHIWEKINLIGITGTKGKSTTTYFVRYILDEYLKSKNKPASAVISSIDTYDGVQSFESHLTTPEPIELQTHYQNAVNSGIEYLTMEVSSQALKYDRVYGVGFDVGCFLNIGEDHISDIEHPDFDDYFHSKLKLFAQAKTACVCMDSQCADEVLKAAQVCERVITFSSENPEADIYAYNIRKVENDTVFMVRTSEFESEFVLTIPGLFNVQNALAAIAISMALGIPQHDMYVGLMKARSSGRMEIYSNVDNKVIVIVDYAHNKMSFESLYQSVLKEFPGRRIATVFGCPGKKAFVRRHDLGVLSGQYSQMVYLTEEDAGEEPIRDICEEIATHVSSVGGRYQIIEDRGEAIRQAIFDSDKPSVILVTGKGNETRQKRGTEYIPVPSDVEYTLKFLKEYDVEHKIDSAEKISSFQDILPAFRKLYNKTILVKMGGSIMDRPDLIENIFEDIALLKMVGARVVLVHGGGKQISAALNEKGIKAEFIGGYRVTNQESIDIVEMILSGSVNKTLVQKLKNHKLNPVGISGKDANLLRAVKKEIPQGDIGFVGEVSSVDDTLLQILLDSEYVPVISPIASDKKGNTLNVNADEAALAIAEKLGVDTLVFLTDVDGILLDVTNEKTIVHYMDIEKANTLLANGFIGGGMLPKLKSCVHSVENGVHEVVILNGTVKYNLISNFVTPAKIGTTIGKEPVR